MAWKLYFGGPIWTMEQRTDAQAVLVEDGVIRAVGPTARNHPQAKMAEQVDLREKHCCLHLWMPTAISWPVPTPCCSSRWRRQRTLQSFRI